MTGIALEATNASTSTEINLEGAAETNGMHSGCGALAVFCSGSDAQGMNAAVRAVVRMALHSGYKVYFIKEGYKGLVEGDVNIVEADCGSVTGIIHLGGTIIGSANCDKFRTREGRMKAALNLVTHDPPITNLVCIGGEGSLEGANILCNEWLSLLADLLGTITITMDQMKSCSHLNIVCLAASIDNDFCDTDMTIGADSALHRITEAIDCITTTAHSHQRCFVLEVMGHQCGYLALVSALACEADWLFLPEMPPEPNWKDMLCNKLQQSRSPGGQRLHIIIVAEGAIDSRHNPLSAEKVRRMIMKRLSDFDARSTILGHIQRGGAPSAFDRILGSRMGAEAVLALKNPKHDNPACVIALAGNQIKRVPLKQAVEKMQKIDQTMKALDFKEVVKMRGHAFVNNLDIYITLSKIEPRYELRGYNLGVVHIGTSAGGINAATRAFVRTALCHGYKAWGIYEGLEGLVAGENLAGDDKIGVRQITWSEVYGWNRQGGSKLGCSRKTAEDVGLKKIADAIKKHELHGLLIIGGFNAYQTAAQLVDGRTQYPEFCIPICLIPATINNNVPGTEFSLGSDTALNEIVNLCDRIKESATGSKRRVFVVETMGGHCGYLATMAGIAGGADAAYIYENPFKIEDLLNDLKHLRDKIADLNRNVQCGLILRNEKANENYTTDFIETLYSEESKGVYTCRSNKLGHAQQGGIPSTFDRLYGTKLAARSIEFFEKFLEEPFNPNVSTRGNDSAVLIGIVKRDILLQNISALKETADPEHRMPKAETQWWMRLRPLLRIFANHKDSTYISETEEVDASEEHH